MGRYRLRGTEGTACNCFEAVGQVLCLAGLEHSPLLQVNTLAASPHPQKSWPKTHFFSTFFCNKLYKDGGYSYAQVGAPQ